MLILQTVKCYRSSNSYFSKTISFNSSIKCSIDSYLLHEDYSMKIIDFIPSIRILIVQKTAKKVPIILAYLNLQYQISRKLLVWLPQSRPQSTASCCGKLSEKLIDFLLFRNPDTWKQLTMLTYLDKKIHILPSIKPTSLLLQRSQWIIYNCLTERGTFSEKFIFFFESEFLQAENTKNIIIIYKSRFSVS